MLVVGLWQAATFGDESRAFLWRAAKGREVVYLVCWEKKTTFVWLNVANLVLLISLLGMLGGLKSSYFMGKKFPISTSKGFRLFMVKKHFFFLKFNVNINEA